MKLRVTVLVSTVTVLMAILTGIAVAHEADSNAVQDETLGVLRDDIAHEHEDDNVTYSDDGAHQYPDISRRHSSDGRTQTFSDDILETINDDVQGISNEHSENLGNQISQDLDDAASPNLGDLASQNLGSGSPKNVDNRGSGNRAIGSPRLPYTGSSQNVDNRESGIRSTGSSQILYPGSSQNFDNRESGNRGIGSSQILYPGSSQNLDNHRPGKGFIALSQNPYKRVPQSPKLEAVPIERYPNGMGVRGIDMVMLMRGLFSGARSYVTDWWSSLVNNINSPAEIWQQSRLFSNPSSLFSFHRRKRAATKRKCRRNKEVCGLAPARSQPQQQQRSKRVVNGTTSSEGQWPWMVALYLKDEYNRVSNSCGGALIDRDIVLSASHCFRDPTRNWTASADHLFVRLGTTRNPYDEYIDPDDGDGGIISTVRRAQFHPDFNAQNFDNDVALFLLDNPEVYRRNFMPICLPKVNEKDHAGETGVVAGWGLLKFSGPLPTHLQETEVQIVSDEQCDDWYSDRTSATVHITKASLCAGYREGFTDACAGDSGGPLMIQGQGGRWTTVGIVSHGYKCAQMDSPGVYVNVSRYRPWIDQTRKLLYKLRDPNL